MKRLKKEDYLTEEIIDLQKKIKELEKEERERALAKKWIDKLPPQRKKYVLEILSLEFGTK